MFARFRFSSLTARCAVAVLALGVAGTQAATLYWDGGSTGWGAAANWSTAPGAPTPDPTSVAGSGDDTIFNIAGANAVAATITLGANQAVRSLTFNNTGSTAFIGGGTARTLTLGHNGLTFSAGAGPVALGDNTAGNNVLLSLAVGQHTWLSNSSSSFTIANTAATFPRVVGSTLIFQQVGTGVFSFNAMSLPTANGIAGPWAFFGTGGAIRYAVNNGGTIEGYSGGTAAADANAFTSATTNYEFSTAGTTVLGVSRTANTIRYTGSGHTIDLGASGANTLTLNGILTAGSGLLTISRSGGTGSLTAGSTNELVIAGSQSITISAPFSGTSKALTYNGSGTLTLSMANTHTGATSVGGGAILILSDQNALQSSTLNINKATVVFDSAVASKAFTMGGLASSVGFSGAGYDLALQNNAAVPEAIALTVNHTSVLRYYGALTGPGSLIKNGTGTLRLAGANTYTGGTTINAGGILCEVAKNDAFLGPNGNVQVTVNAGAALTLNQNNITGTLNLNGGSIVTGNSFQSNWFGSIVLGAGSFSTIDVGNSGGLALSAVISGPGGLIKAGTTNSPVALNGNNTFSGAVSVNAGGLSVASLNRVSGGTATSNLGAPATVADGTITLGAAATAGTLIYTGNGETTDRVIKLGGTTGGATISQGGSALLPTPRGQMGLLKFTSNLSIPGTANVDNRKTLTLTHAANVNTGANVGEGEISGSIGDSQLGTASQTATSIVKAGIGKWTLSGANSYSGGTRVQAGVLAFTRPEAVGPGSLDISNGAKVRLDYIGTRQVTALTFNNGTTQSDGTYGSTESFATFKDDTRFSGPGTITVGPLPVSSVSVSSSSGGTSTDGGQPVTFTATVTGSQVSGYVLFYDGTTLLGAGTLNGANQATLTTTLLGGGSHTITAVFPSNANNGVSYSTAIAQTVVENRAPTTTVLARTTGSNPSPFGGPVTFTATVAGSSTTGSVAFYDGATFLGTAALNGAGQAAFTSSGLPVGYRPLAAKYLGDAANAPSATSTTLFHTVNPPLGNGKLKVFILVGQSNMQGKATIEVGRDPNSSANTNFAGGLGSLRHMLNQNGNRFGYLADPANPVGGNPGWLTRSDVTVTYWTGTAGENNIPMLAVPKRPGKFDLDPFWGNVGEGSRMGPEYAFGLVVGSQLADQVLLIKYAYGGKSLAVDFRPPTAVSQRGGAVGPFYTGMVSRVNEVLNNLSTYCPSYTGGGYEIAGFAWHQGYNDRINPGYATEYEANLVNLIQDIRNDFNTPNLPVSIGVTGMANADSSVDALKVIAAQMAVANPAVHPQFAGTVATVETRDLDFGNALGASDEGYHWNWSATSYFGIGERMGLAMMNLLAGQSPAKDILTFTIPGQTSSIISGNSIQITVPVGTDVTSLAPSFTLSPLATATPIAGTPRNFTAPQTYTVTAQNLTTKTYTVSVTSASSPYDEWAANAGLNVGVNDGPLLDPDFDGLANLLEFVLGGSPLAPSPSVLPTLEQMGGQWRFEYERNRASLPPNTTQIVQYSTDLEIWTDIPVAASSAGLVTVAPGVTFDHVTVVIPAAGREVFVRLKVTR
jgi:autotransporter-associated beta strand protein